MESFPIERMTVVDANRVRVTVGMGEGMSLTIPVRIPGPERPDTRRTIELLQDCLDGAVAAGCFVDVAVGDVRLGPDTWLSEVYAERLAD